jgi:glutamate 5-kinase
LLIAYAAQAVGVISAVKQAVGKTKQVASSVGGGGGISADIQAPTVTTSAPSFNIVGSSPQTQLATAIGQQEQQPVKAFVVASEVTTAQSLDRNIIEESSLG